MTGNVVKEDNADDGDEDCDNDDVTNRRSRGSRRLVARRSSFIK